MNEQLSLNMKGFNYNIGWEGHCFLEAVGVGVMYWLMIVVKGENILLILFTWFYS